MSVAYNLPDISPYQSTVKRCYWPSYSVSFDVANAVFITYNCIFLYTGHLDLILSLNDPKVLCVHRKPSCKKKNNSGSGNVYFIIRKRI